MIFNFFIHNMDDKFQKIGEYIYEIPKTYRHDMRVPARIFVNDDLLKEIESDRSVEQLLNVATLPGIQDYAIAMPDMHEGYGFPIGGVAAMRMTDGVISPGGVGYDINCGVRLLKSDLFYEEIKPFIDIVATDFYRTVPSGVGRGGKIRLSEKEINEVLLRGANYLTEAGYGTQEDLTSCEEGGFMPWSAPELVSKAAKDRGYDQLGTLGSGNHFLEIQRVDKVYDHITAKVFGLEEGLVTISIHCGSRGLGHQVATDYIKIMLSKLEEWDIELPDRELSCAPISVKEGQNYFAAMSAAANFAWANRHMIMHNIRRSWNLRLKERFGSRTDLILVYDVAHNIAKREKHNLNGKIVDLMVHRKGATRAFGPGGVDLPEKYKKTGQPVLIPGTMGTASYVLCGTIEGMQLSFGSSCHGAGRRMSRVYARKHISATLLRQTLEEQGIVVRCGSKIGLLEEAPEAYKDVEEVVKITVGAGLAKKIARLRPIAVIKGD